MGNYELIVESRINTIGASSATRSQKARDDTVFDNIEPGNGRDTGSSCPYHS